MQTNLHQIHLTRITSPVYLVFVWPESAAAPKTLAVVAEGATFLHDFIAAICLKPLHIWRFRVACAAKPIFVALVHPFH